jgi:hypothetical protein
MTITKIERDRQRREHKVRTLMIERDWSINDLRTVDDCDRARSVLTEALISIEYQLSEAAAEARNRGCYADPTWFKRTQGALRYKKLMLQQVQDMRGQIVRAEKTAASQTRDRLLLNRLRLRFPEQFKAVLEELTREFPDQFGRSNGA